MQNPFSPVTRELEDTSTLSEEAARAACSEHNLTHAALTLPQRRGCCARVASLHTPPANTNRFASGGLKAPHAAPRPCPASRLPPSLLSLCPTRTRARKPARPRSGPARRAAPRRPRRPWRWPPARRARRARSAGTAASGPWRRGSAGEGWSGGAAMATGAALGPAALEVRQSGPGRSAARGPAREGKRKRGGRGAALGDVARPAPTGTLCPGGTGGGSAAVPVSALRCRGHSLACAGRARLEPGGAAGCRAERGAGIPAASRGAGGGRGGFSSRHGYGHGTGASAPARSALWPVPSLTAPRAASAAGGPGSDPGESPGTARPASPALCCRGQSPGFGCSAGGRCCCRCSRLRLPSLSLSLPFLPARILLICSYSYLFLVSTFISPQCELGCFVLLCCFPRASECT